jgi:hypothetical protein
MALGHGGRSVQFIETSTLGVISASSGPKISTPARAHRDQAATSLNLSNE